MGFWSKTFTWWNGATWGTDLWTRLRGEEAGRDRAGNVYYRNKNDPSRRWVIYAGDNDGSRVPPGWQVWLRGTIDDLPDKALPKRRSFEKPAAANATGGGDAWRPSGSLRSLGVRPASTGDYTAWTPDQE